MVRVICPQCKELLTGSEATVLRQRFGDKIPDLLYKGKGCKNCQETGYRGRIGIFEMMLVTDDIRSLILENASARDLRRIAAKQGTTSLREDGFRHVHEGRTTVEEVLRVTKDDTFEENNFSDNATQR